MTPVASCSSALSEVLRGARAIARTSDPRASRAASAEDRRSRRARCPGPRDRTSPRRRGASRAWRRRAAPSPRASPRVVPRPRESPRPAFPRRDFGATARSTSDSATVLRHCVPESASAKLRAPPLHRGHDGSRRRWLAGASLEDQLELVWANMRHLAAAEMSVANIVRVTSYLRDRDHAEANAAARVSALGGRRVPTTAMVVETLSNDRQVELGVIAAA
jgi:2-iminobutanoate/2-iminopropanoate deaminase